MKDCRITHRLAQIQVGFSEPERLVRGEGWTERECPRVVELCCLRRRRGLRQRLTTQGTTPRAAWLRVERIDVALGTPYDTQFDPSAIGAGVLRLEVSCDGEPIVGLDLGEASVLAAIVLTREYRAARPKTSGIERGGLEAGPIAYAAKDVDQVRGGTRNRPTVEEEGVGDALVRSIDAALW